VNVARIVVLLEEIDVRCRLADVNSDLARLRRKCAETLLLRVEINREHVFPSVLTFTKMVPTTGIEPVRPKGQ